MGDILERTLRNGRRAYYARFTEKGDKRVCRATKARTREEAEKWLHRAEARVALGEIGDTRPKQKNRLELQPAQPLTVNQLIDRFVSEYSSAKVKDIDYYRRQAKSVFKLHVRPFLGPKQAEQVKALDIENLRDALRNRGVHNRTINKTLAAVSKMYVWAHRKEIIKCDNPARGVERFQTQASLDYLSHGEVQKLLSYLEEKQPDLYPMVCTALYTGMRKGELLGLRWRNVHLDDSARIDVEYSYDGSTKSSKKRHISVHPQLQFVLRNWRERCPQTDAGLVFPVAGRMGTKFELLNLDTELIAAGCHRPDKPWHALRHTFASHFMMAGGNLYTLKKVLGHSDIKLTEIYAHLSPDFMANEISRMDFSAAQASVTSLRNIAKR